MTDPSPNAMTPLGALFAAEAHTHLQQLDTCLRALERDRAGSAAIESMLIVLHTLKGAARSVELTDLELLCHALEAVLGAAVRRPEPLAAEQIAPLRAALALAPQLAGAVSGRVRNQAATLRIELGALGAQLLAPARQAGPPAPLRQLQHGP